MTNDDQNTAEAETQDPMDAAERAGLIAPTGHSIVGPMIIATLRDPSDPNREEWLISTDDGQPVFIDSDGLSWAIDQSGRWAPVGVSVKVEWLTLGAPPVFA